MSLPHADPGQVINIFNPPAEMPSDQTFALTKTDHMETIRMTIPEGKDIPSHQVEGELTVLCLEGSVEFLVDGSKKELSAGDWLYLAGGQPHSLRALADSSLLLTIY